MYRTFDRSDYITNLGLPVDTQVDGVLVYGTYRSSPYRQLERALSARNLTVEEIPLGSHEFVATVRALHINGRNIWFTTAYGGARISEILHVACLLGSQMNILLGSCGGLKPGANNSDVVIPNRSYATESSAATYLPDAAPWYSPDLPLAQRLTDALAANHAVHVGPTTTCQGMMGETWEMVKAWSKAGFFGVEMEAATVFAVSSHFGVPAAAALRIIDNLIEEETVFGSVADEVRERQRQVGTDLWQAALDALLPSS